MKKKPTRHTTKKILATIKGLRLTSRLAIQAAIIALVICGGVSAIVIQHTHSNTSKQQTDTTSPASQSSTTEPVVVAPTQSTTPSTPAQGSSSKPTSTSSDGGPDADGCVIGSSGYQSCHQAAQQLKFTEQCEADMKSANDSYYAIYNPQWNSYNADVNAERQELNSLVGTQPGYTQGWADGTWLSYEHDRAQQFNAAVSPAYSTYLATYNKIVARGCSVVKTWSDPSLPF